MRKDRGNDRHPRVTSGPGKVMEKIILGAIEMNVKNKVIIRHNQHEFMKGNSYLSNLISF